MKDETRVADLFEESDWDRPFVPTLAQRIAEELIRLRLANNLTQEEFASKVGTTQSAVSRAESGNRVPSLRYLDKIAQVFDVQLAVEFRAKRAISWTLPPRENIIPFPTIVWTSCAPKEASTWEKSARNMSGAETQDAEVA